jgi:hypothetical protein
MKSAVALASQFVAVVEAIKAPAWNVSRVEVAYVPAVPEYEPIFISSPEAPVGVLVVNVEGTVKVLNIFVGVEAETVKLVTKQFVLALFLIAIEYVPATVALNQKDRVTF